MCAVNQTPVIFCFSNVSVLLCQLRTVTGGNNASFIYKANNTGIIAGSVKPSI